MCNSILENIFITLKFSACVWTNKHNNRNTFDVWQPETLASFSVRPGIVWSNETSHSTEECQRSISLFRAVTWPLAIYCLCCTMLSIYFWLFALHPEKFILIDIALLINAIKINDSSIKNILLLLIFIKIFEDYTTIII